MPDFCLCRIDPDTRIGSDIFGSPDDRSDEEKSETKIHGVVLSHRPEMYLSPSEGKKYTNQDNIAKIPDKVMGKKVYIDCESDEDRGEFSRISGKSKFEYPPNSCDVASDR